MRIRRAVVVDEVVDHVAGNHVFLIASAVDRQRCVLIGVVALVVEHIGAVLLGLLRKLVDKLVLLLAKLLHAADGIENRHLEVVIHGVAAVIAADHEGAQLGIKGAVRVVDRGISVLAADRIGGSVGLKALVFGDRHQGVHAELVADLRAGLLHDVVILRRDKNGRRIVQRSDHIHAVVLADGIGLLLKIEAALACIGRGLRSLFKIGAAGEGGIIGKGVGNLQINVEGLGCVGLLLDKGLAAILELRAGGLCNGRLKAGAERLDAFLIGEGVADEGEPADLGRVAAEHTDGRSIIAIQLVDLVRQEVNGIERAVFKNGHARFAVLLHCRDIGIHPVCKCRIDLRVADRVAQIFAVFLCKGIVFIDVIVFIVDLGLTPSVKDRAEEGEHKHDDQDHRADDRKAVPRKALGDQATRGDDLHARRIVQMHLLVLSLLQRLLLFLGLEDLIQISFHGTPP